MPHHQPESFLESRDGVPAYFAMTRGKGRGDGYNGEISMLSETTNVVLLSLLLAYFFFCCAANGFVRRMVVVETEKKTDPVTSVWVGLLQYAP